MSLVCASSFFHDEGKEGRPHLAACGRCAAKEEGHAMKENESANSVVSVRSLVKRYGDILALDHFNLEIGKGEIFGLLGPNGCGKTTAINCMLQLLVYDKGDIELFGEAMKPTRYDLKRLSGASAWFLSRWQYLMSSPFSRTSTASAPCM